MRSLAAGGPSTEELPIGRVFGPYKILSAIQRGGMGELFLAERTDRRPPQNKVVLKRLLADYLEDERYVRMFRSEAKVMSSLDHPNIVKVFDVPVIDGKQCLAMEYVHGRNLAQILRRCRELNTAIPPQVALHIMTEVLRGLDYAHNFVLDDGRPLGLVHRDVTPPNILVSFDGAVKITDFGISKSEMSSVSTTIGVVKGTTRYLAPEQIRGQQATPRSDIFSAAVVLVEALTGEALFDHGTVPPTLFAIVTGQRKPVAELLSFTAPRLVSALERALDLHPERRFRSARECVEALEEGERDLGRPLDKNALSVFLKELFRGAEQPYDIAEEIGPWKLDAMDLTYLFEVQELNAFKSEAAAQQPNRNAELERVKALLKAAVPGANPLDAEQFEPGSRSQEKLVEALTSPAGQAKRAVSAASEGGSEGSARAAPAGPRREETKLERPRSSPGREPPPREAEREHMLPLADTGDVFSDPTQTVDDVIEVSSTDDVVEVVRIDPASLPEARLPPKPKPVPAPVFEDSTRIAKDRPRQKRSHATSVVTFFAGLALGAAGWSYGAPHLIGLLQPAAVASSKPVKRAELPPTAPSTHHPSLHYQRGTEFEGKRPGATQPPATEPQRALLTVKKPAGARVRLNGTWLPSRTPLIDYALAPGEYRIEVVKKKKTKKFRIEAKAGESIDLNRR